MLYLNMQFKKVNWRNTGTMSDLVICYLADWNLQRWWLCGAMRRQCALMLIVQSVKMKASMSLQHFVGQVKQLLLGLPGAHFLTLSYMCNLHMNITMNDGETFGIAKAADPLCIWWSRLLIGFVMLSHAAIFSAEQWVDLFHLSLHWQQDLLCSSPLWLLLQNSLPADLQGKVMTHFGLWRMSRFIHLLPANILVVWIIYSHSAWFHHVWYTHAETQQVSCRVCRIWTGFWIARYIWGFTHGPKILLLKIGVVFRLNPGIQELVSKLQSHGTEVYLISGGFRQMIGVLCLPPPSTLNPGLLTQPTARCFFCEFWDL